MKTKQQKVASHEIELKKMEELSSILNSTQDIIWSALPDDFQFLFMSPSGEKIYGRSIEEFYKNPQLWLEVIHPEDKQLVEDYKNNLIETGAVEITYRIVRPSGEIRWLFDRAHVIYDGNSVPIRVDGIATDITECLSAEQPRRQAEDQLKESEEKYRKLFHSKSHAAMLMDAETLLFEDANQEALDMFGYSREEFLRLTSLQITAEKEKSKKALLSLFENKTGTWHIPHRKLIKKDGSEFDSEIYTGIVKIKERDKILSLAHDITERKRVEETLHESEKRYRSLFEDAPDMIHVVDATGRIVDANPVELKTMGYSREEYIGKPLYEIVHPDYRTLTKTKLKSVMRGESFKYETALITKKGAKIEVEVYVAPHKEEGEVVFTRAIIRDITERKRAEMDIKHRTELEMLIANISSNLVIRSFEEIDNTINEAIAKIGAFSEADRAYVFKLFNHGSTIDNTHEWCAEGIEPQIENLKDLSVNIFPWWLDKLNHFENIYIPRVVDLPPEASAEKEILQAQDIKSLVVVPMIVQGILTGFIGFDSVKCEKIWSEEDVILLRLLGETIAVALKQRQSLLRIKESEESYRGLYNNATDAIYILDREGRFIDVNEGAVNMYGYPKEYFLGKTPEPLAAPGKNDMEQIPKYVELAFNGESQQFEFWGKRKNGEIFPKIVRLSKGHYFGQEVIFAFALDITESKQTEKALQESETRYRNVVENVSDLIFRQDLNGLCTFVNPIACKITGYSEQDLLGMYYEFLAHPDDSEFIIRNIKEQFQNRSPENRFECRILSKSGDVIWVDVSMNLLMDGDRVTGWQSTARDITKRKKIEKKLVASLRELELLDEIRKASLEGQTICQIIEKIIIIFSELCGTQVVSVYLYNKENHRLIIQNIGLNKSLVNKIEKLTGIKLTEFAPILRKGYRYNETLKTGEGFLESDPDKIEALFQEYTDSKILRKLIKKVMKLIQVKYIGALPLVTAKGPVGMITFNTRRKMDKNTMRHLQQISREVALSIENAELFDSINREKQKLEKIVGGIGGGLSLVNTDFRILWMNKYLTDTHGSLEELIGKTCHSVYYGRDEICEVCACKESIKSGKVVIKEKKVTNGETKWYQQTSAPIKDISGNVVQVLEFVQDITKRKQAEEEILKHRKDLRHLSSQLVSTQEAERKRISQELHDELGQLLTAASINLEELNEKTKSSLSPELGMRLEETITLIDRVDEQINDLSFQLRPMMLDELGLVSTMRWYLDRYKNRIDVKVQFEAKDVGRRLPVEVEIALFRVVQEATTNISRHAQATHVLITLWVKNKTVKMSIYDDGKGFNMKELLEREVIKRGMGIIGMQERVNSLKGKLNIRSSPGEGTEIDIAIPLRKLS